MGFSLTKIFKILFIIVLVSFSLSCSRTIRFSSSALLPSVTLSAPSASYMKSTDVITYTATYTGMGTTNTIDLLDADIVFTGMNVGCVATVSGSEASTRIISITGCSGDGTLQIHIARNAEPKPTSTPDPSSFASEPNPSESPAPQPATSEITSGLSIAVIVDNTPPLLTGLTDDSTSHSSKT